MATIAQVAAALDDVLTTTANQAATTSGFIRRQRKLTGATFVQGVVFGFLAHPAATYDQLVQAMGRVGVRISPQALERRFTPAAAACLATVLTAATQVVLEADQVAASLLTRFPVVRALDSTIIRLPACFAPQWPGSGRAGAIAGMKLHTSMDLLRGGLQGPLPTPARPHDKLSPLQLEPLPAGGLRLTDLGFYALAVLAQFSERGVYWLCRAQIQTILFTADGRRWTLVRFLAAQKGTQVIDVPVTLGATAKLPARLVAYRLDPRTAARRRKQVRYTAQRKHRRVSQEQLALCSWDVAITSIPLAVCRAAEIRVLLRARWQIELLFKLWKSEGLLDESRSQKPERILCEVYAKLIGLVLQQWCLVLGIWSCLERSVTKAGRVVREHALLLARAMRAPERLHAVLAELVETLQVSCRVNKRRNHPSHAQLIAVHSHATAA